MMISKKIKYLLTFIMLFTGILPVYADDNSNIVDFSKKGSISITLTEEIENTNISGAEITIYKVADAISENNNLKFSYDNKLNSCKDDLDNANITSNVLNCVKNSNVANYSNITNEYGIVKFNNLDLGLYLITQSNQIEGYSKITPFLVMIPEILDNNWNYTINASPKVDIIRLFDLSVEKVWNVSNKNDIPKEITIELVKNNEVIDTITLSNENNWTYTWTQIEKSDEYLVREKNVPTGYTVTYHQEDNKFIVTNTKTLAQTGQRLWINLLLVAVGLLFIGIGTVLKKRKKYE